MLIIGLQWNWRDCSTTQVDRRRQCLGQRLIKHRGTFAPALLTNLSLVKMTAGEAWHSPRPYAKSPFWLLCLINSQNGLSVYRWAFWHGPSRSYGYEIMSWGSRSIFAGLFYHYILNKRFIVSRQGKKNAKVKDTGRVKYIAMERRTLLAGAKAAKCVYPKSLSCFIELPRQRHLSIHAEPLLQKTTQGKWLQEDD